jgi:hypothetical protein
MVARITGPPDPLLADRLGELKLPVLIQWGELDRWIPLSDAYGFQRGIAGAELRVYAMMPVAYVSVPLLSTHARQRKWEGESGSPWAARSSAAFFQSRPLG